MLYTIKNYKGMLNLCLRASNDMEAKGGQEKLPVAKTPDNGGGDGVETKGDAINACREMQDGCIVASNSLKGGVPQRGTETDGNQPDKQGGEEVPQGVETNENQSKKPSFSVNGESGRLELSEDLQNQLLSGRQGDKFEFTLDGIPEEARESSISQPTYGGVLPETIASLEVNGQEYKRSGINGEFKDSEGNPLEMKEGQVITISEIRTEDEIKSSREDVRKKYDEFIGENGELKDYGDEKYRDTILMALEKGVEPQKLLERLSLEVFGSDEQSVNREDLAALSSNVTFGRVPNIGWNGFNKGAYTKGEVQPYLGEGSVEPGKMKHYNVPSASEPYANSGTSTLCSQTARLNLEKMGCVGVVRGNAFDAWRKMGSPKNPFPPKENGNIKAIDLRVASKSPYGHRAAAFIKDGKWFVLDPYRSGGNSTEPISAEEYMGKNQIVGAFYYSFDGGNSG